MARFEQLNKNTEDILLSIIDNQNLCKLIHYDSNDPFSEKDIEDTSELLFERIFPFPKIPGVETKALTYLNVYMDNFLIPSANNGVKEALIIFNVITHNDLWRMEGTGMLRPYSILHEIDEMFNKERVIGIKKLKFNRGKYIYLNNQFGGYEASYVVTSVN
ncbi:hypothetical protein D3C73_185660 [compost metagenome]